MSFSRISSSCHWKLSPVTCQSVPVPQSPVPSPQAPGPFSPDGVMFQNMDFPGSSHNTSLKKVQFHTLYGWSGLIQSLTRN